jgi:hypothetical protein
VGVFYENLSLLPEPTGWLMLLLGAGFAGRRR